MSIVRASRPDPAVADAPRWVTLLGEAAQLARMIANTNFVPKAMRGDEAAIAAAILYGDEVGLPPMQALAKIAVIDGKPSVAAEAQRALIQAAGHSLRGEGNTTKFTWVGQRADNGDAMEISWTMDDAKRAGLAGKQNWRTYPRAMLSARASAELARALFADVIGGLAATEELEETESAPNPAPAATPQGDTGPPETAASPSQRRRRPARTAPPPVIAPAAPTAGEPPEPALPDDEPEPAPKATDPQMRKLMAMFAERGMTNRELRLEWTNRQLDRTIQSASELTDIEASQLIQTLEEAPSAPVPADEPQQPTLDEDDPPVTTERLDVIMFLRRESQVSDAWLVAKLAELGVADMPKRPGREDLKRLTRSEAMVLSDALSSEVDKNS